MVQHPIKQQNQFNMIFSGWTIANYDTQKIQRLGLEIKAYDHWLKVTYTWTSIV